MAKSIIILSPDISEDREKTSKHPVQVFEVEKISSGVISESFKDDYVKTISRRQLEELQELIFPYQKRCIVPNYELRAVIVAKDSADACKALLEKVDNLDIISEGELPLSEKLKLDIELSFQATRSSPADCYQFFVIDYIFPKEDLESRLKHEVGQLLYLEHHKFCKKYQIEIEHEYTYAMLKPDIASKKQIECYELIQQFGFSVIARKRIHMSKQLAQEFYKEHFGRSFFDGLISFMTSGPIECLVLSRVNGIRAWRRTLGPTDSNKARIEAPSSIRAQYGTDNQRNACHGSDSKVSARREINIIFPNSSVYTPQHPGVDQIKANCAIYSHVSEDGMICPISPETYRKCLRDNQPDTNPFALELVEREIISNRETKLFQVWKRIEAQREPSLKYERLLTDAIDLFSFEGNYEGENEAISMLDLVEEEMKKNTDLSFLLRHVKEKSENFLAAIPCKLKLLFLKESIGDVFEKELPKLEKWKKARLPVKHVIRIRDFPLDESEEFMFSQSIKGFGV